MYCNLNLVTRIYFIPTLDLILRHQKELVTAIPVILKSKNPPSYYDLETGTSSILPVSSGRQTALAKKKDSALQQTAPTARSCVLFPLYTHTNRESRGSLPFE